MLSKYQYAAIVDLLFESTCFWWSQTISERTSLFYMEQCVFTCLILGFFPLLPRTTTYNTASTAAAQLGLALLHLDATWAVRVLRPPTLPLHTHDFTFRWHSLPLIWLKYSSSLWINNNSEGGWSHYRGNWPHHSWIPTHRNILKYIHTPMHLQEIGAHPLCVTSAAPLLSTNLSKRKINFLINKVCLLEGLCCLQQQRKVLEATLLIFVQPLQSLR